MRNSVPSLLLLEPEMSRASFGAGTCQNSMIASFWPFAGPKAGLKRNRGYQDRARRQCLDDHDTAVPRDRLIGQRGEHLTAAANRQQHLAGAIRRNGNSNPSDLADQALVRTRHALRTWEHVPPAFTLNAPFTGIPLAAGRPHGGRS